jgi:hypothetical protein
MNSLPPLPPHLGDVVARWRSAARAGGWRAMSDWSTAAIAEVASAAVSGDHLDDAVLKLGRDRAIAGVGIAEGLDDLDRLWVALGDIGAPTRAARAFAEGWADTIATPASRPALDASSGLTTTEVLRVRIDDLLRTGASEATALVVVDVVDVEAPRFARHLEVAVIGALITETLPDAESPVRLARDRVAAITPRSEHLEEGVIRLRHAVDRRVRGRGDRSVVITDLPAIDETVDAWLASW